MRKTANMRYVSDMVNRSRVGLAHGTVDCSSRGSIAGRVRAIISWQRHDKLPSLLALLFLGGFALPTFAQESRWGSPEDETVKFMIAAEAKWANSACSPQPDLKDVIADDFQGTSPSGRRYDKAKAITSDTKALERDCLLGEVKVRFFGDSIAIAYGGESAVSKAKDGKETKHCLIWTDTWLKRAGKWQIVAAQDTDIPCIR